jgi:hypothetical protein
LVTRATAHPAGPANAILILGLLALRSCTLLWPQRAPGQLSLVDVFQDPVSYPLDRTAKSLSLAALDGDGTYDLVFIDYGWGIATLLSHGDGAFEDSRCRPGSKKSTSHGCWTRTAMREGEPT